jgi:hypothetical protein
MLQSLISLSDEEIEIVTSAVREWCRANNYQIDSLQGRRAITVAIDIVQTEYKEDKLIAELTARLAPLNYSEAGA